MSGSSVVRQSPAQAHAEGVASPQAEVLAVTVPEAQRVSGIGRTAIYEAIAHGDIEAVKRGTRTLILTDSLRSSLARLPRFGSARKGGAP